MCGIVARLGADRAAGAAFAARGIGLLGHRGPDGTGSAVFDEAALGHCRLAILDLSAAGHQPLVSPDGRFTLIFNGELYNHRELRARHCAGWPFRGHGDAETVLALLSRRGPEAFAEMVGMWALAFWDRDGRRLLVSRDRYGQKPLYWRRTGEALLFASEIRPLLALDLDKDGERPEMEPAAVAEYLATGNYGHLGERTFLRGVASFPPGCWAWVAPGDARPAPQRYWRFPADAGREAPQRPYDQAARRRFRDAFLEAVSSQLLSDVPIAATLSGGLDSSAVVGAIATLRDEPLPVFTAQTGTGGRYDESRYVQAVEARWPGRLEICRFAPQRLVLSEHLPAGLRAQEEPFGDPSILAHRQLMADARAQGVKVVLGGQGADELLFGYPAMSWALVADALRRGPRGWALAEARSLGGGAGTLARIALAAALPAAELRLRERSRQQRRGWLSPALREAAAGVAPRLASAGDLAGVWREAVEETALPHLTHYDDRNGMAESLEGRMPFLDHRLADAVADLEVRAFLDRGLRKRILREALADLLPTEVAARRDKIGFHTPLPEMIRAEEGWVRERLGDPFCRSLGLFDPAQAAAWVAPAAAGEGAAAGRVFRALSVRLWAEEMNVRPLGGCP
jgi:asparagine synthase (glutamine-hydrolysing)